MSTPLRVLLTTDHFPPFIGGGHRWSELVARGLAGRGHDVSVATVWSGGLAHIEQLGEPAVDVHRVRQMRTALPGLVRDRRQRHAPPFPDPVSIVGLRRVIKQTRPDVVVTHGWISFSVVPALARTGIPLLASVHDYGYFCANRTLLHGGVLCSGPAPRKCVACAGEFYGRPKGWLAAAGVGMFRRPLRRRLDGVHSISAFVDEVTAQHLLGRSERARPAKRFVVPSAFMDSEDTAARTQPTSAAPDIVDQLPDEPFILFVGALRPIKGIDVLLNAYAQLDGPPPLVLIGTIERDTPQPFPPGVTVLTDVPHDGVMAAWERALVGVAPSVWPEPLGLVAVEAITAGTPMIGTRPGGTVDVLDGGAGVLVPQGDAEALASALRSLIESPQRRRQLAAAARARSAQYRADRVLARYEEMLEELVRG